MHVQINVWIILCKTKINKIISQMTFFWKINLDIKHQFSRVYYINIAAVMTNVTHLHFLSHFVYWLLIPSTTNAKVCIKGNLNPFWKLVWNHSGYLSLKNVWITTTKKKPWVNKCILNLETECSFGISIGTRPNSASWYLEQTV